MFPHLYAFGGALVKHWLALASGAAVLTVLGIYERRTGADIPWNIYGSLLLGFIAWASFLAWRDEHERAQTSLPVFQVHIDSISTTYFVNEDQSLLLLTLRIVNKGADSAILNYQVRYRPTGGVELQTQNVLLANDLKLNAPIGIISVKAADLINYRTNTPIPRGGFVAGKLAVTVQGNRTSEVANGQASITATVTDYLEQPHVGEFKGTGQADRVMFVTGEPVPSDHQATIFGTPPIPEKRSPIQGRKRRRARK